MKYLLSKRFTIPLASYFAVVATIIISRSILSHEHTLLLSAGVMLWVPFLLDRNTADVLRLNVRGLILGTGISFAVLFCYLACLYLLSSLMGQTVKFTEPTVLFVITHLVTIAFPEEFFFRGYLQRKFGGRLKAVVATSVLFALAHFLAICVFSGGGACTHNILTFFPSLVMGYLYMRTGTIWSSVFFHFAANIVYLSFRIS